jgi:hypothetical protein
MREYIGLPIAIAFTPFFGFGFGILAWQRLPLTETHWS